MKTIQLPIYGFIFFFLVVQSNSQQVNTFTGAFGYPISIMTVPGPNGSDYKITLQYNSGVSPQSEASWVGYGWNLDIGSISRDLKGYPDDWNKVTIKSWNKQKPNWTATGTYEANLEVNSHDEKTEKRTDGNGNEHIDTMQKNTRWAGINGNWWARYNSNSGFWKGHGYGLSIMGAANLSYMFDERRSKYGSWGGNVSPTGIYHLFHGWDVKNNDKSLTGILSSTANSFIDRTVNSAIDGVCNGIIMSSFSSIMNESHPPSYISKRYTEEIYDYKYKLGVTFPIFGVILGPQAGISGTYVKQETIPIENLTACGYMYSAIATKDESNSTILMDYYTEKELNYNWDNTFLPIPIPNNDLFVVNGVGPQGVFKIYQQSAGHFRPNSFAEPCSTKFGNYRVDVGVGFAPISVTLGSELNIKASRTYSVSDWGLYNNEFSDFENYKFTYNTKLQQEYNGENILLNSNFQFRFINDSGGEFANANSEDIVKANFGEPHSFLGLGNILPGFVNDYDVTLNDVNNGSNQHDLNKEDLKKIQNSRFSGTSYNINYTTIGEECEFNSIQSSPPSQTPRVFFNKAYTKEDQLNKTHYITKWNTGYNPIPELKNQIGEFAITDPQGMTYVYGLPVFTRHEKNIQIGLKSKNINSENIIDNTIVYSSCNTENEEVVTGEERSTPYANTYLITEIRTPDYFDLTGNGPTEDDLGGYVKFNYKRLAGDVDKINSDNSKWFTSRAPYNGMSYYQGELCDDEDDRGTYYVSEREIYVIESIETKTHIALFINNKTDKTYTLESTNNNQAVKIVLKGSQRERLDNYEGITDDYEATGNMNATTAIEYKNKIKDLFSSDNGNTSVRNNVNKSVYLEKIVLYAKKGDGVPIQTTCFNYDYTLMQVDEGNAANSNYVKSLDITSEQTLGDLPSGLPNSGLVVLSQNNNSCNVARAGKLTLRQVWSEYGNIKNYHIKPYTFHYLTKNVSQFTSGIWNNNSSFHDILNEYDSYPSSSQNPPYNISNIDAWGCYQIDGVTRNKKYQKWNSQKNNSLFDPSAYNLKWVQLPSGSEIHIQYESNSYSYVQDRPAMAMVSIVEGSEEAASFDQDGNTLNKYFLNLDEIGINNTVQAEVESVKDYIVQNIQNKNERLYFKFLYRLKGDTKPNLISDYTNASYINGYCKVKDVGIVQTMVGGVKYNLFVTLKEDNNNDYCIPRQVCQDYCERNKRSKLEGDYKFHEFSSKHATIWDLLTSAWPDFIPGDYCKTVDFVNSYIRIPIPKDKIGGGVRVKRLLTYDPGIEVGNADAMLLGTEYKYTIYDKTRNQFVSSGVATNEPQSIREENALIRHLSEYDNIDKVISGRDKVQYEGIIGESLLPKAMVGYSRVVSKSIYDISDNQTQQKPNTSVGFTVSEYYTTKDFPFISLHKKCFSDIQKKQPVPLNIPGGIYNYMQDHTFAVQGYSFTLNDMNGKMKNLSTYGGVYSKPETWFLSSQSIYEYYGADKQFDHCDNLDVINNFKLKPWSNFYTDSPKNQYSNDIYLGFPGKEIEVFFETRQIREETNIKKAEGDVKIGFWDFAASVFASMSETRGKLSTHVTTKIVRYPSILKRVIKFADGATDTTDFKKFYQLTGAPIVSQGYDGYNKLSLAGSVSLQNGTYQSITIPAASEYVNFGQKSQTERRGLSVSCSTSNNGRIFLLNVGNNITCQENEIYLNLSIGDLLEVKLPGNQQPSLYRVLQTKNQTVEIEATSSYFQNQPLLPTNFDEPTEIFVVESGKKNNLTSNAGNVVLYGTTELTSWNDSFSSSEQRNSILGLCNTNIEQVFSFDSDKEVTFQIENNEAELLYNHENNSCGLGQSPTPIIWKIKKVVRNQFTYLEFSNDRDEKQLFPFAIFKDGIHQPFILNNHNMLAIRDVCGHEYELDVFQFCDEKREKIQVGNVISANASTFEKSSSIVPNSFLTLPTQLTDLEKGMYGRNKLSSTFVFRSPTKKLEWFNLSNNTLPNDPSIRSYNSGVFLLDWFNYKNPVTNTISSTPNLAIQDEVRGWTKSSTIEVYSQDGVPLQTRDVLSNVKSVQLVNNSTGLPNISVANGTYNSVLFRDFEPEYGTITNKVGDIGNNFYSHTGKRSLSLTSNPVNIGEFVSPIVESNEGLLIRYWSSVADNESSVQILLEPFDTQIPLAQPIVTLPAKKIARTGIWTLFQIDLRSGLLSTYNYKPNIKYSCSVSSNSPNGERIDDFIVQPYFAEVNCTIYDYDKMRVSAVLDNNHFATYNQYNPEGIPLRTRKETIIGVKTVSEVETNTPVLERTNVLISMNHNTSDNTSSAFLSKVIKNGPLNNIANSAVDDVLSTSKPLEAGQKFGIADITINEDGVKANVFKKNVDSVFTKESISNLINRINQIDPDSISNRLKLGEILSEMDTIKNVTDKVNVYSELRNALTNKVINLSESEKAKLDNQISQTIKELDQSEFELKTQSGYLTETEKKSLDGRLSIISAQRKKLNDLRNSLFK